MEQLPPEGAPETLPEYDPRLRECANKIKELVKEYDCACVAVLHCPTHTENIVAVSPSYSCATIVNDKFFTHEPIAAAGDDVRRKKIIADTVNMLNNLRYLCQKLWLSLTQAQQETMSKFGIAMPQAPKNGSRIIKPGKP